MYGRNTLYGRNDDEWETLVDAALDFLIDVAKARTKTTGADLSLELARRTGHPGFDVDCERDRIAIGELLRQVVDLTYADAQAMLSAVVTWHGSGNADEYFYRHATQRQWLTPGEDRLEFLARQVSGVHDHYSRVRAPNRFSLADWW